MKRLLSAATTCLLLITLCTPLFAQSAGKGALTGTVTDSTGAVVVAAPLPIVGGSGSPARVLALVPAQG